MPEEIVSTLSQIAHSHQNPSLFSDGVALSINSLLEDKNKKFKFTKNKNLLYVKTNDNKYKDVFVCFGIVIPPLEETKDCMLQYDPINRPPIPAYSHEAQRAAIYIGTQKEFNGPIFNSPADMGIIIYLSGINNITADEVADQVLHFLDLYKAGKRGFYTYWHGQDADSYYDPVWPLGLMI